MNYRKPGIIAELTISAGLGLSRVVEANHGDERHGMGGHLDNPVTEVIDQQTLLATELTEPIIVNRALRRHLSIPIREVFPRSGLAERIRDGIGKLAARDNLYRSGRS